MAIDTREKRRAVIDFGKLKGTGMPVAIGSIPIGSRLHVLNLYPGIVPVVSTFFFWRNRTLATSNWQTRTEIAD